MTRAVCRSPAPVLERDILQGTGGKAKAGVFSLSVFEWVHLPAAALTPHICLRHLWRKARTDSSLPAVGVRPIVQQELDHLLVPGTGAVKQGCPAVDILHLQLRALLQGNREWPLLLPPSQGPPVPRHRESLNPQQEGELPTQMAHFTGSWWRILPCVIKPHAAALPVYYGIHTCRRK